MAQNKKEVTFEETSLLEKFKDNQEVLKVLNRMEECWLCARGTQMTTEDQTPQGKAEELINLVKRFLQSMTNVVNDMKITVSSSMLDNLNQMFNLLKSGLDRNLERIFAIVLLAVGK